MEFSSTKMRGASWPTPLLCERNWKGVMRWVILSDVHGNLQALESVLERLKKEDPVDGYAFLGDALGYGADPNPCMEILREVCGPWVLGNHDHGVLGLTDLSYFNLEAREAIQWCASNLDFSHRIFLESQPLVAKRDGFQLVHASPRCPEEWDYLFTYRDAQEAFEAMEGEICFVGHSHIPLVLQQDPEGNILALRQEEVELLPDHRYVINPGSIGQPRDGDCRASFGIYDAERRIFRTLRVTYDVSEAARRILKVGLPSSLAHRLFWGS